MVPLQPAAHFPCSIDLTLGDKILIESLIKLQRLV